MAEWLVVRLRYRSSLRRAEEGGSTSFEEPIRCRIGVGAKPVEKNRTYDPSYSFLTEHKQRLLSAGPFYKGNSTESCILIQNFLTRIRVVESDVDQHNLLVPFT